MQGCSASARHNVTLWEVDAAHPSPNAAVTETQLAGNVTDNATSFIERSDLIKYRLTGSVTSVAHRSSGVAPSEARSDPPTVDSAAGG